jgi:hypothetical protein
MKTVDVVKRGEQSREKDWKQKITGNLTFNEQKNFKN